MRSRANTLYMLVALRSHKDVMETWYIHWEPFMLGQSLGLSMEMLQISTSLRLFITYISRICSDETPPEVQATFYQIRKSWSYQMRWAPFSPKREARTEISRLACPSAHSGQRTHRSTVLLLQLACGYLSARFSVPVQQLSIAKSGRGCDARRTRLGVWVRIWKVLRI